MLLQQWLADYLTGQTHPLPFFPRVCLKAAEAYLKDNKKDNKAVSDEERWQKAYQAALSAYNGGYDSTAQRDYAEVALLFGKNETSPLRTGFLRKAPTGNRPQGRLPPLRFTSKQQIGLRSAGD